MCSSSSCWPATTLGASHIGSVAVAFWLLNEQNTSKAERLESELREATAELERQRTQIESRDTAWQNELTRMATDSIRRR